MLDKPFEVKYRPISIKDILKNMHSEASLSMDMAFYSIIYGDKDVAQEIEKIDENVDEEFNLLSIQLMMAARDLEDAKKLLPALRLGVAIDTVVEAASDIASTVLRGYTSGDVIKAALEITEEIYLKVSIDSKHSDMTIEEFVEKYGAVDVIALRSSGVLIINPSPEIRLKVGDTLILRGDRDDILKVAKDFNVKIEIPQADFDEKARELAQRIALLKNLAELSFDLAVYSILYQDKIAAEEVLEIESFIDEESTKIEMEVMNHIKCSEEMYVSTVLIRSLEKVSDAATRVAQLTLSNNGVHPVLKRIKEEGEEKILVVLVKEDCDMTLAELEDLLEGNVLAIYVPNSWIPIPNLNTKLEKGMKVLMKIYDSSEDFWERLEQIRCPIEIR
ncbi:hypothetical protein EYM_00480 [Ignicoccus islandicus DSM 13165]|uniref:RCK C-terminal domain-containing protein n=1 Tax=Ignicoccus islandicus DSM 13165 TaxID=940295 RepID=A0A0U2U7N0_9CREN|nr:TrkA C-terminal domain-containing protein [Ignicoccus islandicus]ALU12116.1 hypothetical protein EYM_00480 [Ignicoccus islandicus DSM 13165]